MAVEVERKFLVCNDNWRTQCDTGLVYRQAYIFLQTAGGVLRVRIAGDRAVLCLKIGKTMLRRLEYEYEIPPADAGEIMKECCDYPPVVKRRHRLTYDGSLWEVDEFLEKNDGLVLAEIELAHEEEHFSRPPWMGREVSDDTRYLSFNLYRRPFTTWPPHER